MSSVYRIENEEGMGPLGRRGIELTREIMYRHYRRDEDFVYAQMAEDVTWIGPSRPVHHRRGQAQGTLADRAACHLHDGAGNLSGRL